MNHIPLEIAEKICEYLPLKECIKVSGLNERFAAASERQLKKRATHLNVSSVNAIWNFIEHIFPHIRTILVDEPQTDNVRLCMQMCANVETVTYKYVLRPLCDYDLSRIKTLEFRTVEHCLDVVLQSYLQRCSDQLHSLVIEHTYLLGSSLNFVPHSVRRLHLLDSICNPANIISYLRKNPNIEDFFLHSRIVSVRLPQLLATLGQARKLGLTGGGVIVEHFQQLAQMRHLVELHLQIRSVNFCQYPKAMDETHKLETLHLAMNDFAVSPEFAKSFTRFQHITKLTIYIGQDVEDALLLVRPIVLLAQRAKLESLVLAGFTEPLDLAANRALFNGLKMFRVCATLCVCQDHLHLPLKFIN